MERSSLYAVLFTLVSCVQDLHHNIIHISIILIPLCMVYRNFAKHSRDNRFRQCLAFALTHANFARSSIAYAKYIFLYLTTMNLAFELQIAVKSSPLINIFEYSQEIKGRGLKNRCEDYSFNKL